MSVVCPQGHTSQSEDYCDTCGAPIEAGGGQSAAPEPTSPAEPTGPASCPHCGAAAPPKALFCENCGYDFTTGTAPQPRDPLDLGPSTGPLAQVATAEPPPQSESAGAESGQAERAAGEPGEVAEAAAGLPTPPTPGPDTWVAEVWVDPDWYEAQEPEDPMPAPGSPRVVPLREASVLVGRPSASRHIRPDIDAGTDTGVSRRHCQLSTDGHRWWVEDLDSSNGTYVGGAGEELPSTPIDVGVRRELSDGDRVFVGGWTRIVVRKALPGEA